jgi:Protein of unknown function (DUF2568)
MPVWEARLQLVKAINLAVRFALELCAIAALAYWGFKTGDSTVTSIVLGVAAPVTMVVVWGMLVAPKARFSVPKTAKWLLGLAILLVAAIALVDAGSSTLAVVFGVLSTINAALMLFWDQ